MINENTNPSSTKAREANSRSYLEDLPLLKKISVIIDLVKCDFQKKYGGSYLGIIWALLHPFATLAILLFVFQVGLKAPMIKMENSGVAGQIPFPLWLAIGLLPWFYFVEAITNATNSIVEYQFLIKKVVFPLHYLPMFKIISALVIHLVFFTLGIMLLLAYERPFNWCWLQGVYYLLAEMLFILAFAWPLSALAVVIKDVAYAIGVVLQFAFWITPIVWNRAIIPNGYLKWLYLNPMFYIVEGYRDSFLQGVWFWQRPLFLTVYFWGITLSMLLAGWWTFRRMRNIFADYI